MHVSIDRWAALALAATLLPAAAAAAEQPVDTAIVVAADASGSIDAAEFRLQRDGIAAALTNARVLQAISGGPLGRIAVAYVEWGSPGRPETVVGWTMVADRGSAEALAAAIAAAPRSSQSYNAIGDALDHATHLFAACGCQPTRRVIDISGDNADMRSRLPAPAARDAAVAAGITVNALAVIENDRVGPGGRPWLVEYYERDVVGGPGAFVMAARDRADFARALLDKMVLEIAGRPAPGPVQAARAGRAR